MHMSRDLALARSLTPAERRRIREAARIPRSAIADDVGVSTWTVGRWETGATTPGGRHGAAYGALLRDLAVPNYADTAEVVSAP